jgi:hypothetical protein
MNLAIDANRYSDLCRGIAGVVEVMEEAERLYLPFVVLGELRAGFAVGTRGPENERVLRRFLPKDGVEVLWETSRPRTTTHPSIDNSASKGLRSRRTTCGSRRWSSNTG